MKRWEIIYIGVVLLVSAGLGIETYLFYNMPGTSIYNPEVAVEGENRATAFGFAVFFGFLILLSVMMYLHDKLKQSKRYVKKTSRH